MLTLAASLGLASACDVADDAWAGWRGLPEVRLHTGEVTAVTTADTWTVLEIRVTEDGAPRQVVARYHSNASFSFSSPRRGEFVLVAVVPIQLQPETLIVQAMAIGVPSRFGTVMLDSERQPVAAVKCDVGIEPAAPLERPFSLAELDAPQTPPEADDDLMRRALPWNEGVASIRRCLE